MTSREAADVIERFLEVSQRQGELAAVESGGKSTSYGELAQRARDIEARLVASGLRPGQVVSVYGESSVALIISVLGVLAAGGVLLLIDQTLPRARQNQLLDEAEPAFVLSAGPQGTEGMLAAPEVVLKVVDRDAREILANRTGSPAYLFFTSGSTGAPKAVVGSRQGLAHFVDWEVSALEVRAGDRVGQLTSLSFDVVLRDIFLPLCSGATLVLPDRPGDLSARTVVPWLDRREVTILHTVPSIARRWLARRPAEPARLHLRATCFAGEPLDTMLVDAWRDQVAPMSEVWNFYGPTETTLAKFAYRITGKEEPGILPVGKPLPGCRVVGVDTQKSELEPAELVLSTPHRSLGYLGHLDVPAGGFFPDGSGRSGAWAYRTGDLATRRQDGNFVLHGRADDQVKIRGVRVEPAEVSAHLRAVAKQEGAQDAIVLALCDSDSPLGEKSLQAWVDGDLSASALEAVLRRLRELLPLVMVPARIRSIAIFPLLPNGKIDRLALVANIEEDQERAAESPTGSVTYSADRVADICDVMSRALSGARVTATSDFFALGGDSLAVEELVIELEEAGIGTVNGIDVLLFPTPEHLARHITARSQMKLTHRAHWRGQTIPTGWSQLSPQQRRFAAFYCRVGDRNWSNVVLQRPLATEHTAEILRSAVHELSVRHPSLRTQFEVVDGSLKQRVVESADFKVPLSRRSEPSTVVVADAYRDPIPITGGAPWIAVITDDGGGRDRSLVIALNHMVTDGASQSILKDDLDYILDLLVRGKLPKSDPANLTYLEITNWLLEEEAVRHEESERFWLRELASFRSTGLPRKMGASASDAQGAFCAIKLDGRVRGCVEESARSSGCTVFVVVAAAFGGVLSDWLHQDDVTVLVPTAGRNVPGAAGIVGNFHNIVPLRFPLPARKAELRAVQMRLANALDHQMFQLDSLVEALGMSPDAEPYPLSSILMNSIPGDSPLRLAGGIASHGSLGYDVRFDAMCVLRQGGAGWVLELHYRRALLDPAKAETVLQTVRERLLVAALA